MRQRLQRFSDPKTRSKIRFGLRLINLFIFALLVINGIQLRNNQHNIAFAQSTNASSASASTSNAVEPPPAQGSAATAPADAAPATPENVGDAGGGTTGNMNDMATAGAVIGDAEKASIAKMSKAFGPGAQFMADNIGQNRVGINMTWLLFCGFLVMFMQAGFALVETGFCRAKNAAHTMMMNFACYFLGITGFWICGFAFMYGNAGPIANVGGTPPINGAGAFSLGNLGSIFATHGFFLSGNHYDVGVYAMFLFQMVFMDTAVTIVTGSMAERWKFSSFIVYCFFMSCILYPFFGHWAWGGGWLSQLGQPDHLGLGCGYVDFAGSGVVHAIGGLCALAGSMVLGPRLGRYNKDGSANPFPGHHIPMAILGCIILGFGWFGFNPGSTFGAAGFGNLRIGIVATTTMLAGAAGAVTSMIYMYMTVKKPDPTMVVNGFLAGLVAITAPSGFVSGPVGFLIGGIAGILVCISVPFWDKRQIDDPVGAISVHGVCGMFGVLCVGLFADGTYGGGWNLTGITKNGGSDKPLIGLFPAIYNNMQAGYQGPSVSAGMGQLMAQLIGMVTLIIWGFGFSYLFFKVQKSVMGLRVTEQEEMDGLDLPETGVLAYPAFASNPER